MVMITIPSVTIRERENLFGTVSANADVCRLDLNKTLVLHRRDHEMEGENTWFPSISFSL